MSQQAALRGLADAAPRRVDHAPEGDRVGGIGQQREIGERVLDLGALVELRAADHLVGDVEPHQRVLQHAALGIRPVEDRDVAAGDALLVCEPLDLGRDVPRLGVLVLELGDVDGLAAADVAPQLLGLAALVVRHDRVRRREDRLRGAVVLLQLHDMRAREVTLEVEDVRDVRAAEAVDRLVVVADHADVALLACEQLQQPVLRVVGVLVLVDQDPAEGLPVALCNVGEQLQHVHRPEQQVVEVERVHLVDPLLVQVVHVGDRLLEERADALAVGRRRPRAGSSRPRSAT